MKKIFYIFLFSGILALVLSLSLTNFSLAAGTCADNPFGCDENLNCSEGIACHCHEECSSKNCEMGVMETVGKCGALPTCAYNPFGCDENLNCSEGIACHCDEECSSKNCEMGVMETVGKCGAGDGNGVDNGVDNGGGVFSVEIENPLKAKSFKELIDALINFIFWMGITIAPIMFIIAGFYFVTSMGDPERVRTAGKIMLYTTIGLALVLAAKGLILVLKSILGVTP